MKRVPLSRGKFALIDDEDFAFVNQWKWHFHHTGYAERNLQASKNGGFRRLIRMHRILIGATEDEFVDHINGNRLDNRRNNLRIVQFADNIKNQKIRITNTSGFKGVNWSKHNRKWCARISINYRRVFLGYFDYVTDAARAYNKAALKYYGKFAKLNEVNDYEQD